MTMLESLNHGKALRQELRDLARQILKHNSELERVRPVVAEVAEQIKRSKAELADREIRIIAEVASELNNDLNPKPRYTSVDARKTEANKRIADDAAAQQMQSKLYTLDTAKFNAELSVKTAEDSIHALDYVRSLMVAEAELLVSILRAETTPSTEAIIAETVAQVTAYLDDRLGGARV